MMKMPTVEGMRTLYGVHEILNFIKLCIINKNGHQIMKQHSLLRIT